MGFPAHPLPRSGGRNANRLRLGVSAALILPHGSLPCLIDDIALRGARLRIERKLAKGETALLSFHELRVYGTVVWWKQGECGLRFDQPLDLEDMQGMLWITQNRALYDRICRTGHALDWSEGLGD